MRFPEFSGEWEKTRFENVVSLQRGSSPRPIIEYITKSSDGVNWVKIGDMPKYGRLVTSTEEKITKEGAKKSRRVNMGDLILSNSMSYGQPYIMNIDGYIHDGWFVLKNFEKSFDRDYLCNLLISPAVQNQYRRLAAGGVVQNISSDLVNSVIISLPSIKEQQKIASVLNLIDERIATQRKIIEDLKKLKDAIAEKLFCGPDDESPELRVVNSSDKWNLYQFKDVCQRISERNSQGSSSLVLTIAAQYGLVSQTDFFNKSVASENLSNYHLIQKGDFAYNKSYSGEYARGAVKRLELYENGVLSPLYICFRPNPLIVNSDFLSHYFETHKWHNGIAQIAGEGARNHGLLNVSITDYFATLHRFPELPEQKKIASYLNSLSDKISLADKELECYAQQKQYLLSRMFI